MSWRDDLSRVTHVDGRKLIGASFRGVPFFVELAEQAGGRRTVTHEFPGRDDPYVEDLGRRARTFRVDGYVIGGPDAGSPSYVLNRDELLGALESEGPGELVHPYHGRLRAVCTALAMRESVSEGGLARFTLEFTETPAQAVAVEEAADLPGEVEQAAVAASAAMAAELEDGYDASGLPAFAVASAAEALGSLGYELGAALAPIVSDTQELARLDVEVRSLISHATSLVREPADVVAAFAGVLAAVAGTTAGAPGAVLRALVTTYGVALGAPGPAITSTREREIANHAALVAALRRLLAVEAARLAPLVAWSSHEEAIAARDEIAELLDEQAAAADDDAYPALVRLRAAVAQAVPGEAVLASLVTVDQRVAASSLRLTYQLYGSVDQEADVIARNRIRHPGFVAGTLQVLSRG